MTKFDPKKHFAIRRHADGSAEPIYTIPMPKMKAADFHLPGQRLCETRDLLGCQLTPDRLIDTWRGVAGAGLRRALHSRRDLRASWTSSWDKALALPDVEGCRLKRLEALMHTQMTLVDWCAHPGMGHARLLPQGNELWQQMLRVRVWMILLELHSWITVALPGDYDQDGPIWQVPTFQELFCRLAVNAEMTCGTRRGSPLEPLGIPLAWQAPPPAAPPAMP